MNVEQLYELLWDFARQRVVTVAAKCGILGELAVGARNPEELAAALDLDAHATGKVVRALCALGDHMDEVRRGARRKQE